MNWKKLLALFIVLIGVGVFYFWDQKQIEEKEAQEERSKQLFSWELEDVASFSIKNPFQTISLRKVDGVWELVNPVQANADQDAVQRLLEQLQDAKLEQTIAEDPEQLDPFGLNRPQLVFSAEDSEGKDLGRLTIGDEIPIKSYFYAKVDDASRVFTVAELIKTAVEKEPSDLRDKDLFKIVQDKVQKVAISYPDGPELAASKTGEGNWRIEQPLDALADSETISEFIGKIEGLKVKEFVAEKVADASPYGLVDDVTRLMVFEEDRAEPVVLEIGSSDPSRSAYHARMEGKSNVVTVEETFAKGLPKKPFAWRPKNPLPVWDYQAEFVKIEKPGEGTLLELVKDESKQWNMIEPVSAEYEALDSSTLRTFLNDQLHDFEIVNYVTDTLDAAELVSPDYIITVSGEIRGESKMHTLLLGKEDPEGYLVFGKRGSDDEIFVADNAILQALEEPFARFLKNPPEMGQPKSPPQVWLPEIESATGVISDETDSP